MNDRRTFDPRLVAGLVAAGIAGFAALMLLIAYAPEFRSGRDGRAHALSVSAVGFQGLVRLAGAQGESRLIRNRDELYTEDLVVVALEAHMTADMISDMLANREGLPTLLILQKWAVQPHPRRRGWVQVLAPVAGPPTAALIEGVEVEAEGEPGAGGRAAGEDILDGIGVSLPASPQTISGPRLEPLLTAPDGGILAARLGSDPVYLVADPDLLNNHGLADPERARAALDMLGRLNATGSDAVHFDLLANGLGAARSPLRLAFEPPFLALTLALFAAALLAGLHGLNRFGPPRREPRAIAFGKSALVENMAGLIRLADREHHLGGAYAELIRDEAGRATGAPAALRGAALETYLNRLTPPHLPRFSELSARLHAAGNRSELIAAAQALFDWKKEVIK